MLLPSLPSLQVADLHAQLSATEEARAAAHATIADLRRELADRQMALTAAQDAAGEAAGRAAQLEAALEATNAELAGVRKQLAAAAAAAAAGDGSDAAAAAAAAAAEVCQLQGLLAERDGQVEVLQAQVGGHAVCKPAAQRHSASLAGFG